MTKRTWLCGLVMVLGAAGVLILGNREIEHRAEASPLVDVWCGPNQGTPIVCEVWYTNCIGLDEDGCCEWWSSQSFRYCYSPSFFDCSVLRGNKAPCDPPKSCTNEPPNDCVEDQWWWIRMIGEGEM